jgi:tetratricopeptide (TPR) repeat protein/TolB-like protein
MIYVEPFAFLGASTDWNIPLTRVREKLADALSRFDEINVVSDLGPGPATGTSAIAQAAISPQRVETKTASDDAFVPHIDYRLAASAESPDEGVITLMFRLIDTEDGTIVWSKNFERIALGADPREPENAVIRELATILGQPFGIVHTHERMKLPANSNIDPRYACLLATFDYWRDYDVRRHAGVRSCLRQAIEMDPTFALGFAALARVYFREYQFGIADDETPPPPLDRALTAARRAITLKPNSVRAHRVLADIYLARGEVPAALAAGDKALALNPYDLGTLVHVGTQLAALGELDRARTMLRQAAFFGLVRPVRIDFGLFLLAYLSGDFDEARTLASELPRDKFALGYLARALICVKNGDDAGAQRAIAKLVNLQPGIRNDLRGELGKFFPGPPVVDRLARDLTKAGLLASN